MREKEKNEKDEINDNKRDIERNKERKMKKVVETEKKRNERYVRTQRLRDHERR
jgi:hypothetical protein